MSREGMEGRCPSRRRGTVNIWCRLEVWQNGCSVPKLVLPSAGKYWRRVGPCCRRCCWVFWNVALTRTHKQANTHLLGHVYTKTRRPLSVCQNVSRNVLAPANQARDSAWQTPPQQESSCHLDKWTLEEWRSGPVSLCSHACVSETLVFPE